MESPHNVKTCTRCGKSKPPSEYGAEPRWGDGLQSRCRDCQREVVAERRARLGNDAVNAYQRSYYARNKTRMSHLYEYGPARKAQTAVNNALAQGKLTRPDRCELCKEECSPQAHHNDYDKPLEIQWLCTDCHWELTYLVRRL